MKPLPGAPAMPAATAAALAAAVAARPEGWEPRTRHLEEDGGPMFSNRLALESSPYLLQHAHNPVDWWPWGSEAFKEAEERGVLVLLSVGYATCHWCHVMEEESFEDAEMARLINANFVAVKVDREERPDVDGVYMAAAQAVGGRGGWPLTVALTAEREPAWVATYLPPEDGQRGAAVGLRTVLERLAAAHREGRLAERAAEVTELVRRHLEPLPATAWPGIKALVAAGQAFEGRFDRKHGGVVGAPKFPGSMPTGLLLRLWKRFGDGEAKEMAILSLSRMAAGGIHDHLGGGFHRYSVDERWLVPHFEKMLYDNALLARDYLDGWQATGEGRFAAVARSTLEWVAGEMTTAEGAFMSATDADSLDAGGRLEEGPYFTWTPSEVRKALGDEAEAAMHRWGVVEGGHLDGRSVLHEPLGTMEVGERTGLDRTESALALERARKGLLAARARRPAPLVDHKVQASWNGLAIAAFARAGLVLGEKRHTERARQAAQFVLGEMRVAGRLVHSWCEGKASEVGFLEDAAAMAWGVLALFEATGEARWLREAEALMEVVEGDYLDHENGGYFATVEGAGLLAREKPFLDGAIPSGNGMAALVQARLGLFTGKEVWRERALATVRAFGGVLARAPAAAPWLLAAVDALAGEAHQVVVVSPEGVAAAERLLRPWRTRHLPNGALVWVLATLADEELAGIAPMAAGRPAEGGEPTAYVCLGTTCSLPTSDPGRLAELLDNGA